MRKERSPPPKTDTTNGKSLPLFASRPEKPRCCPVIQGPKKCVGIAFSAGVSLHYCIFTSHVCTPSLALLIAICTNPKSFPPFLPSRGLLPKLTRVWRSGRLHLHVAWPLLVHAGALFEWVKAFQLILIKAGAFANNWQMLSDGRRGHLIPPRVWPWFGWREGETRQATSGACL